MVKVSRGNRITIKHKEIADFELVSIHWNDAYSLHNWRDLKDLQENELDSSSYTAGFLLKVTKKFYVVALNIGAAFLTAADVIYIPKGMVKGIKYHGKIFELDKGKRRRKPV